MDRWAEQKPAFDEYTAMQMDVEYDAEENAIPVFRINMDNTPLLNEIKQRRLDDVPARTSSCMATCWSGFHSFYKDKDKRETAGRC